MPTPLINDLSKKAGAPPLDPAGQGPDSTLKSRVRALPGGVEGRSPRLPYWVNYRCDWYESCFFFYGASASAAADGGLATLLESTLYTL